MNAIEALKDLKNFTEHFSNHFSNHFEMILECLKKEIPAYVIEDGYFDIPSACPMCGYDIDTKSMNYCPFCGQRVIDRD